MSAVGSTHCTISPEVRELRGLGMVISGCMHACAVYLVCSLALAPGMPGPYILSLLVPRDISHDPYRALLSSPTPKTIAPVQEDMSVLPNLAVPVHREDRNRIT